MTKIMAKLCGIKAKRFPVRVNSTRDELPEFFIEMGYQVGAEIGVFKGEFSEKLCEAGLTVFSVDPWRAFAHHLARNPDYQRKVNGIYKAAARRLAIYENNTIVRKTSMDGVVDFQDESLDFVYIDGDHGFRCIAEDLVEWSKKVKVGGVVSGHDYHNTIKCQVGNVVDAYVKSFGIEEWYLIGDKDADNRKSWFWVKR